MSNVEFLRSRGYNELQIKAHLARKERQARAYAAAHPPEPPRALLQPPKPEPEPEETTPEDIRNHLTILYSPIPVSIAIIKDVVCEVYGITLEDIEGKSQRRVHSLPRQVAIYLATRFTKHSSVRIAHHFGGRDHSTVIHARNAIVVKMWEDRKLLERVEAIAWNCKARAGQ